MQKEQRIMAKNFKQLKGKFGRVLGYPYDPKQDPGRAEPIWF